MLRLVTAAGAIVAMSALAAPAMAVVPGKVLNSASVDGFTVNVLRFPTVAHLARPTSTTGTVTSGTNADGTNPYGGSPLACSVGLTVLDVVEKEKLADNIFARGEQLKLGLQKLVGSHGIKEVRGYGGLVGMIVEEEPSAIVAKLTKAGLILIPAANHAVRFLPPLNVTAEEIAEALRIVEETL